METWEVRTKKQPDGHCKVGAYWCGYCERCDYMGKTWASMMPGRTIDDWREANFRWALHSREDERKRRAAVTAEVMGDAPKVGRSRFIKVGFKEGTEAKGVYKKLINLMSTNLYKCGNSVAVIEFYSASHPKGGNLHFHLLTAAECTARVGVTAKQLGKYFNVAPNFVQVDPVRGEAAFEQKLRYVLGDKTKEKMQFVELDSEWREELGFPAFSNFFNDDLRQKYVKYLSDSQTGKL